MKGIYVKKKLQNNGFSLKAVAEAMGETPQNLNSMLSAQDIKTGVLEKIATAINKNLYFFFDEKVELMTKEEMAEDKRNTGASVPQSVADSEAYQRLYNKYVDAIQELDKKNTPNTMTTDERIDALIRQNDGLVQSVQDVIKMSHETIAANQRQSETNQEIMKQLLSMLDGSKKTVRMGDAQVVAQAVHV